MSNNKVTIPPGFRQDAKGRLVHENQIKPLDLIRDQLVQQLVAKAKPLRQQLASFREHAFSEIDSLVDLALQEYRATLGGEKGNVTLLSFDGRYKVIRARADKIIFDERLQAAKALIDECLAEWTAGARTEISVLVNEAFKADQAGNIRTGTVLSLRRFKIDDPRWKSAMDAIGESVQVIDSKSYLRLYERDDQGEYQPISLDIAAVRS